MMEWWTVSSMAAVVMGLANVPCGRLLTTVGRPPGYWCGSGASASYSATACALRITDSGQLRDRVGNDRLKSATRDLSPAGQAILLCTRTSSEFLAHSGYGDWAGPRTRYPLFSSVRSATGNISTTTLARPTTSPFSSKL